MGYVYGVCMVFIVSEKSSLHPSPKTVLVVGCIYFGWSHCGVILYRQNIEVSLQPINVAHIKVISSWFVNVSIDVGC